jgi:hypothetical protein
MKVDMGKKIYTVGLYKYLKPQGERPPGRPRLRWEDNITVNSRGMGCEDLNSTGLSQDRDQCWVSMIMMMNLRFQ